MSRTSETQIVLVRHGRPDVSAEGFASAAEFGEWIRLYKSAEVGESPPAALKQLAASIGTMFVSTSPRAMTSAALISPETAAREHSLFDETYLPRIRAPLVRMPISGWKALAYISWFFGNSSGGESKADAVSRAHRAARFLTTAAEKDGRVMLIGHEGINRFIRQSLQASGWKVISSAGGGFWSVQHFSRTGGHRLGS